MSAVAPKFTACDACTAPATQLVSSNDALGGNPAYGSFRSFRCDRCADAVVAQLIAADRQWAVQPLRRAPLPSETADV